MNEKALLASYDLAVQNGYKKSIDEFKQLLSSNTKALDVSYNLALQNGYKKTIDDYKVLMGLGEEPLTAQEPIVQEVKKKDTTESPLGDGSSASSASADPEALRFAELVKKQGQIVGKRTDEPGYIDPRKKLGMYPTREEADRAINQALTDISVTTGKTPELGEYDDVDYFTGSFGNVLRGFDKVSQTGLGELVDDIGRSFAQGYAQGDLAQASNKVIRAGNEFTEDDVQSLIDKSETLNSLPPSQEFQKYLKTYEEEGKSVWGAVKGLMENPTVLGEVAVSSLVSMATNREAVLAGLGTLSAAFGTGAATGGAAGSFVIPGVGTVVGAAGAGLSAAASALPFAFGAASTVVETGSVFAQGLQEQLGTDENGNPIKPTKENVRAILEDPEKYNKIKNDAILRGFTVGIIDAVGGKLATGVGAKILRSSAAATGNITKAGLVKSLAAGGVIEGGSGGLGEGLGQVFIGKPIDTGNVVLEIAAEMPGALRSTAMAALKVPTYKINKGKVSAEEIDRAISTMTPEQLAASDIEIYNDFEGRKKLMQDKIVTGSIAAEVRAVSPNLNEPTVNAIVELQKELNRLEGNKTQVAKDRAAVLRTEIKNLQENQLPEVATQEAPVANEQNILELTDKISNIENVLSLPDITENTGFYLFDRNYEQTKAELEAELETLKQQLNAIQKQAAGQVPVQPTAGGRQEVAQGEPQAEPQVTPQAGTQEEVSDIPLVYPFEPVLPIVEAAPAPQVEVTPAPQAEPQQRTVSSKTQKKIDKVNEARRKELQEFEGPLDQPYFIGEETSPTVEQFINNKYDEQVNELIAAEPAKPKADTAPVTVEEIKVSFTPENATEVKRATKEVARGRTITYDASITAPVTDKNGATIGIMTKRSDTDLNLSFTLKDANGRDINKGKAYPTERDARTALVEQVNRVRAKAAPAAKTAAVNKKASEVLAKYEKGTEINLSELETVQPPSDSVIKTIFDEFKKAFKNITIVGKRATEGAAFYDTVKKRIELNKNSTHWNEVSSESLVSNLAHEFVHQKIDSSENKQQIETELEKIKQDLIAELPTFENEGDKKTFSFITSKTNSPQEVLTYMVSNPELRKYLGKHEAKLNEISQQLFGIDVIQPQQTKQNEQVQSERRGDGGVSDTGRKIAPLKGAPTVQGATGPDASLVSVAEQYAADNGIDLRRQAEYVEVDEERAKRIADAYEQMANDPKNPKVKEAYEDLIRQTKAQYDALRKAGYEFTFFDDETDPYDGNPNNAMRDLRQNKKMAVYGTFAGYGTEGITDSQVENNPLLVDTGLRWKDQNGKEQIVTANDLFRAVHDAFGHGLEGSGFRARGEENAWQAHVRLFTGPAIGALTSETRGQNSWLNFGPFSETNRTAKVEDTIFAEQKIGLMPEFTWTEGRASDMKTEAKPAAKKAEAKPTPKKAAAKTEPVATKEVVEEIEGKLTELSALDPKDKGTGQKILDGIDALLKDYENIEKGGLNIGIALPAIKAILKGIRALVQAGMTLNDAIKQAAKENNVSVRDITNGINTISQIIPIQTEFNTLMDNADALIAAQKKRGIDEKRIVSNLDAMVRAFYKDMNVNDAQRKLMEREARARMGVEPRKAASIGRVLGVLKDITNVSREEKLKIISRIRELGRDVAKDLAAEIRELSTSGKITVNQAASIIARTLNINPLNEASVTNFVDYMAKVFSKADYVGKMTNALKQIKQAKKNIKTKIGVAQDLFEPLNQLLSINPTLIPLNQLEKYLGILEDFGARKEVLTVKDRVKVLKQVNEILEEISNEQSLVDVLADRFNNYDGQVFNEEDGLNYAATIKKMIDDGIISTDEADLMKKYKSEILPQVEPTPATDAEIEADKKKEIKILKELKIDNKEFPLPSRDEKEDALSLAKLIKELSEADLMNLSLTDLKNIIKVIGNINNGYLPHYAKISIEKLNAIKEGKVLSNAIERAKPLSFSKLYSRLKDKFTKKGAIDELIRANPLYYIDNVFGDFKTRDIFNSLLEQSSQALARFNSELKRVSQKIDIAQNKVLASFNQNPDNYLMSKFRMTTYMLQREYESNIGKKGVRPVSEYLKETIKHIRKGKSVFREADAEKLEQILKELDTYNVDGTVDLDKFYNSFNNAEKNAIKVMTEINASLGEKAAYTASVIRGNKVELMDNYFHHNVLHEQNPMDATAAPEFSSNYSNSMRPTTKAKSLIERTGALTPLNFDLFTSTQKGAKFVLLDYNLTSPIRTARRTLIQAENNLQKVADKKERDEAKKTGVTDENKLSEITGTIPKQQRDINNAINNAYEEALDNILTNNIVQDDLSNEVFDFIQKQGYRAALAGTTRFQAELASNIVNALIINPKGFATGIKHAKLIASANGYEFMNNAKSKQTSRLYSTDALSGRMVDPQILKQTSGIKGSISRGALRNRTAQIYNLTLKRFVQNPVEYIADTMLTTPDKVVSMPLWFGSFMNEFKRIAGEEVNQEMMINNDLDYMQKYADAIEQATRKADQESVYSGAANNEFMGVLKGKLKPNQGLTQKVWNNFNSYMTNFMNFDYAAARSAVYNLFNEGYMTKRKAAAVLAGITTRSVIYQVMVANMGAGIVGAALGLAFDWEDEEEVDEKSYFQMLGRGLANVLIGYTVGRNFGNGVRGMINFGVEKINEEYLDFLRNGEYDFYKDNIAYTYLNVGDRGDIDVAKMAVSMAGPYTPALNTAVLIGKNFGAISSKVRGEGPTKKEPEAIRREEMTLNYRIPLELAGNAGLIPFYKDVKKAVNDEIYKDLRKAASTPDSSLPSKENYEKIKDLRAVKDITSDEEELKVIRRSMIQLNGTDEQKESVKAYNKRKEEQKKRLLYDSDNGVRYDNETEMERYNKRLYIERFGRGSEWDEKYKAEDAVRKKLTRITRQREDEEYGYRKKN